jgi:hypothetical protein
MTKIKLLILVENIDVEKSHINEICVDCLKICFCKILFVLNWICLKIKIYIFGKIQFVFKLDIFKNNGGYVLF